MRSQNNLNATAEAESTITFSDVRGKVHWRDPIQMENSQSQMERRNVQRHVQRIPRHEQDEDLWRYASPGRDPVTAERGPGI